MNRNKVAGFVFGYVASALLGAVSLPVVAWFSSAENIGRLSMLQVSVNLIVILFGLGLDQAYVREYHEIEKKHRPELFRVAFLPGMLTIAILAGGVCLLDIGLISNLLFSIESGPASTIAIVCFMAAFASRHLSLILRMEERAWTFSLAQFAHKSSFLLLVSMVVVVSGTVDLIELLWVYLTSSCVGLLIHVWNTRATWVQALKSVRHGELLQRMLHFGIPLAIGGLASWALMSMDRIFLRAMSTFEELGVYSIGSSIASAASVLSGVFGVIWAPLVYKWFTQGKSLEEVDKINDYLIVIVFGIFLVTISVSWVFPLLLPDGYARVRFIVAACMTPMLFYVLAETANIGIGISRKTTYSMLTAVCAAIINAMGNFFLVPAYGAKGAAISTAVAFWFLLLFRNEISARVWRPVRKLRLYVPSLICLFLVVGYAAAGAYMPHVWILISICGLAAWAVYFRKEIRELVALLCWRDKIT